MHRSNLKKILISSILSLPIITHQAFAADSDRDSVDDLIDNCIKAANKAQRDTDNDGFGNFCDPDLNNDEIINDADIALFRKVYLSKDPDADFNGDGIVNETDYELIKSYYDQPPGPSNVRRNDHFAQNPPDVQDVQLFTLDEPQPNGSNAVVMMAIKQRDGIKESFVLSPNGELAPVNDAGVEPDIEPGDGIYSGFVKLNVDAAFADEQNFEKRLLSVEKPIITEFSGRDVVNREVFPQRVETTQKLEPIKVNDLLLTPILFKFANFQILPVTVNPEKTQMMTDTSIVADPGRTFDMCDVDGDGVIGNVNGPWSFKTLMANMANQPLTGITTQQFIHEWLKKWMTNDTVNSFTIDARTNIQNFFPGWDGINASTLDINQLPFRLLSIVNRIDLADSLAYGAGSPGETRFVFGLVNPLSCSPSPMTVIFEYGDVTNSCTSVKTRAQQWTALDSIAFPSAAYNTALQNITDTVTLANAVPSKPNGSALNQLRTNDIALAGPWELREFTLQGTVSTLHHDTIKQTPDRVLFNNSVELAAFMEDNANAILCESHTVPENLEFPTGSGTFIPFLGASVEYGFGSFWNAPLNLASLPTTFPTCHKANTTFTPTPTTAEIASELRHKLSLNTCDDCHSGETSTAFTHVSWSSSPATLSGFLTGVVVADPAGSGIVRTFNDLDRRAQAMEDLATKSCFNLTNSFHTDQVLLNIMH